MDKIVKVKVKNVAVSPVKARLVADLVRKMSVKRAIDTLTFLNKKSAVHIKKALLSGVASAKEILGVDEENMKIAKLTIDAAKVGRGFRFESRGRVSRLVKRKSHINLEIKAK